MATDLPHSLATFSSSEMQAQEPNGFSCAQCDPNWGIDVDEMRSKVGNIAILRQ